MGYFSGMGYSGGDPAEMTLVLEAEIRNKMFFISIFIFRYRFQFRFLKISIPIRPFFIAFDTRFFSFSISMLKLIETNRFRYRYQNEDLV